MGIMAIIGLILTIFGIIAFPTSIILGWLVASRKKGGTTTNQEKGLAIGCLGFLLGPVSFVVGLTLLIIGLAIGI